MVVQTREETAAIAAVRNLKKNSSVPSGNRDKMGKEVSEQTRGGHMIRIACPYLSCDFFHSTARYHDSVLRYNLFS